MAVADRPLPSTGTSNQSGSPSAASAHTHSGSPSLAGAKRKRNGDASKFYAVRIGKTPGIYYSWPDCLEQVKSFPKAQFKSFTSFTDAESFLQHGLSISSSTKPQQPKFYAVRSGKIPGIYTDWPTAEAQIRGWKGPKYKSFLSRAEADAFMRGLDTSSPTTSSSDSTSSKKKKPAPSRKSGTQEPTDPNTIDTSFEPGTGPLPNGAEDGFDPRVKLNATTGKLEYKTDAERAHATMQSTGLRRGAPLEIWTDGSSMGNGKAGARAGVGVWFGPAHANNVSERLRGARQTNQRAELTALSRALDLAPLDRDVRIYSDSNYAIRCVTEWFVAWRANGWLTAGRKAVENRDLVETIVARIEEREGLGVRTRFEWVKGHGGNAGNEAADRLAVAGAMKGVEE